MARSAEILLQNRRINRRQSLDIGDGDMLVDHMHRRADEAEFDNRAIGADEPRIRSAAARRQNRLAPGLLFDGFGDERR